MDASTYHAQAEALLKAIGSLDGRIHDGYVPDSIPTDGVYILPYVLMFSGTTTDIEEERDLRGLADLSTHDWRMQTNCVGPTPSHARAVAGLIQATLTNARIGNGWLLPDNQAFRTSVPIKDDDVKPARFFLPLSWRLTTTH